VLPRGVIKSVPEDFVVEELPLYLPSGEGDHLYVRFTKRNLPTDIAVRMMARALGVDARDVGVAGLKDKVGVTTQTISIPLGRDPAALESRVSALALEGITIHEAKRHTNKLRTGHLAGNAFTIVVRDLDPTQVDDVARTLERIGREGAPNAFGTQRFGRDQDNAQRARAWLRGEWAGPRDGRQRRFLFSSLQSAIFNDVLRRRVEDGTWLTPLDGDVLQKEDSGGLFLCADVQADRERAARGEVSPTGPMVGVKMRAPTGAPLALETAVTTEWLGEGFDLARVRQLGEGTRRPLRTIVRDLRIEIIAPASANEGTGREQRPSVRVYFVLPKGTYATTVLTTAMDIDTCASDGVSTTEASAAPSEQSKASSAGSDDQDDTTAEATEARDDRES
jgi:tRNA pseudouridine13 synthase